MISEIKHIADAVIAGEMDFEGQSRAGRLGMQIMSIGCITALMTGSVLQRLDVMVWIVTAFCVVAGLIVVPSWPIYRRNLLAWQPHKGNEDSDGICSGDQSETEDQ